MTPITIACLAVSSALVFAASTLTFLMLTPLWDYLAAKQMGQLTDRFERLALDTNMLYFALRVWGIAMVAIFFALWLGAGMLPIAITVTLIIYTAPRHILHLLILRQERLLRDQLVSATTRLGNAVKAGLSIAQGIDTVTEDTPPPLSRELSRIANDYQRGRPLREAIAAVRQRLNLEDFTLFALAIEVALDRGGRLNEALDRISHSLGENQRVERKLEAETANGRRVVLILGAFPVGFLLLYYFCAPDLTWYLYSTFWGHLLLAGVIGLVYVGYRYATFILNASLR